VRHIDLLQGDSVPANEVRVNHPFIIHGWVVLPDHLHCVMELPQDDDNFAIRWKLIKSNFSRHIEKTGGDLPCVNVAANAKFGNADSGNT
jgi:putative transposase